jgi:uracil-DNA glycosylase
MANCYRKQRTSGGNHSAWLPICANKFMSRLIRIIRPEIIIVVGKSSFGALHCMEDLSVKCIDQSEKGKGDFSEIIEHNYKIDIDGLTIDVFPVYHPGSNSQINRSKEHQLEDWKRIAIHYNKIR